MGSHLGGPRAQYAGVDPQDQLLASMDGYPARAWTPVVQGQSEHSVLRACVRLQRDKGKTGGRLGA